MSLGEACAQGLLSAVPQGRVDPTSQRVREDCITVGGDVVLDAIGTVGDETDLTGDSATSGLMCLEEVVDIRAVLGVVSTATLTGLSRQSVPPAPLTQTDAQLFRAGRLSRRGTSRGVRVARGSSTSELRQVGQAVACTASENLCPASSRRSAVVSVPAVVGVVPNVVNVIVTGVALVGVDGGTTGIPVRRVEHELPVTTDTADADSPHDVDNVTPGVPEFS